MLLDVVFYSMIIIGNMLEWNVCAAAPQSSKFRFFFHATFGSVHSFSSGGPELLWEGGIVYKVGYPIIYAHGLSDVSGRRRGPLTSRTRSLWPGQGKTEPAHHRMGIIYPTQYSGSARSIQGNNDRPTNKNRTQQRRQTVWYITNDSTSVEQLGVES